MNILFVSPINRTYVVMPLLGIGYLASIAQKNKHSVSILDCKKEKMDFKEFETFIRQNRFDLICFQVFTYDINSVKQHTDIIRRQTKNVTVIAGGPHPSSDPIGTLKYLGQIDFAFKGESEIGFKQFLKYLSEFGCARLKTDLETLKKIPGLIFNLPDNKVIVNNPVYVEDLDSLDFPAWELMDPRDYPEAPHGAFAKGFPVAPIIITRGCPFLCTFCAGSAISGYKTRKRSIDNVWQEIEYLIDRFGIKEVHVEDENFTLHNDLLKEFCIRIINSGHKISWSFPTGVRLDTLNKENLRLMEEAGCYSMAIGIEFGSQRIHDLTKKRLSIELIKEKISLISQTEIKTTGFFLMGIPGETKEEMLSTIDLALKLKIGRVQFNNFMPLPGSELWDTLMQQNKLSQTNWSEFFVHGVAYLPEGISRKEMKNMQRLGYLRFYLRPRTIYNVMKDVKSIRHFRMLFHRFLDALH